MDNRTNSRTILLKRQELTVFGEDRANINPKPGGRILDKYALLTKEALNL
jgi:hypothetical protein